MVRFNAMASIASEHAVSIDETVRFLLRYCPERTRMRLERSLEQAGNQTRNLVMPLEALSRLGGAGERTDLYHRYATELAERAVAGLVGCAGITTVIFVSNTGWVAPSIDTHIVRRFGLNRACRRIPLAQLGCGGGVAACSLAAEIVGRDPTERVLIVSVEVPSLHLQLAEPSYYELIAAAHFADGAAAAIVSSDDRGPEVVATASVLLPEIDEGGRVLPCDTGLRLVASPGLPRVIRARVRDLVGRVTSDPDTLAFVVVHPRGRDVLDAVAEGLPASPSALVGGYAAWQGSGNMVSASIYRALAELVRRSEPADGHRGLMLAFGTGLACEMAAVRWRPGADVVYA